jgi:hypothetical protein
MQLLHAVDGLAYLYSTNERPAVLIESGKSLDVRNSLLQRNLRRRQREQDLLSVSDVSGYQWVRSLEASARALMPRVIELHRIKVGENC